MSDDADLAEFRITRELDLHVERIKKNVVAGIEGTGECIVCGSEVQPILHNCKIIIPRFCADPACKQECDAGR